MIQTSGVYTLANLVRNASDAVFLSEACSVSLSILAAALSLAGRTTLAVISPVRFIQPEYNAVPSTASTGRLSPVTGEVSTVVVPFVIIQSTGIRSPGFILMISSHKTSVAVTSTKLPSRITSAVSGQSLPSSLIAFLDLPTARD